MTTQIVQNIPTPTAPVVDKEGRMTQAWRFFMVALWNRTGGASGSSGSFANLNGDSTQLFSVATANAATDATPLAQVQSLDSAVLSNAETYAASQAATAQSNAETYALNQIQQGTGAAFVSVTPGASPYTYTAAAVGNLLISGGTISAISIGRGTGSATVQIAAPFIPLDKADTVTITYSAAPTLTWIPR